MSAAEGGLSDFARAMAPVALEIMGEPTEATQHELRFGTRGSLSVSLDKGVWRDHETGDGGGVLDFVQQRKKLDKSGAIAWLAERGHILKPSTKRAKSGRRIVATYDYPDEHGEVLFQVVRYDPKDFRPRRPDGKGGWISEKGCMKGVRLVLYRFPAIIAAVAERQTIYIAEGEKGVHALESIGLAGTNAPGGAGKWRREYGKHLAGADVVVLADNDPQATMPDGTLRWHPDSRPILPGQDHSEDVAAQLHGIASRVRVLMLPFLPLKGDIADWIAAGGTRGQLEDLAARVPDWTPTPNASEAKEPPEAKRGITSGRLTAYGMDDLDTAPDRDYLLKGLISPGEISLWVGPPKCGKSFLLLYVAYMLSLGRSVFGRRVKPTKVLYVAAEGEGGIGKRIRALRDSLGRSHNFHYIAQPIDLLHDNGHKLEVMDLAKILNPQLIVVDTLSRALSGGNENAPDDMGTLIRNVSDIKHDTKAHVAIVHHGTKASNGASPRGHGSLEGADDALVEVAKQPDGSRIATVVHAKDDADGMSWGFNLDVVDMGEDDDGDQITTLIVREHVHAPEKAEKLSPDQQLAFTIFGKALKAEGTLSDIDGKEQLVLPEFAWRNWFYREAKPGAAPETKRQAFTRCVEALMLKGRIVHRDSLCWLP